MTKSIQHAAPSTLQYWYVFRAQWAHIVPRGHCRLPLNRSVGHRLSTGMSARVAIGIRPRPRYTSAVRVKTKRWWPSARRTTAPPMLSSISSAAPGRQPDRSHRQPVYLRVVQTRGAHHRACGATLCARRGADSESEGAMVDDDRERFDLWRRRADDILAAALHDIVDVVVLQDYVLPPRATIEPSLTCSRCGLATMASRTREVDGEIICDACWHEAGALPVSLTQVGVVRSSHPQGQSHAEARAAVDAIELLPSLAPSLTGLAPASCCRSLADRPRSAFVRAATTPQRRRVAAPAGCICAAHAAPAVAVGAHHRRAVADRRHDAHRAGSGCLGRIAGDRHQAARPPVGRTAFGCAARARGLYCCWPGR